MSEQAATTPETIELPEELSAAALRERLQAAVLADLLGPAHGPEEIVDEQNVRDRYLIGRLGPQGQRWSRSSLEDLDDEDDLTVDTLEEVEGELDSGGVADSEDGAGDTRPPQPVSMQPSSLGLSFVVDGAATHLRIRATWGRYIREAGQGEAYTTKQGTQRRVWRRVPMQGVAEAVPLQAGRMAPWSPHPEQPDVRVHGLVRRRNDHWHVTLFLVNGQTEPRQTKDTAWIFQPELCIDAPDGSPIFVRRPRQETDDDPELRSMNMRYRDQLEFAVGHGASVHAVLDASNPRQAVRLETRVAPFYDVPQTLPFVPPDLEVDMRVLAQLPDGHFGDALMPLVTAYRAWIDRLAASTAQPDPSLAPYIEDAAGAIATCRSVAQRIQAGIELLDANPQAAQAFRFANRAMADQRVHSLYASRVRQNQAADLDAIEADPGSHVWRTFQLAFILLNLPGLTDATHPERGELADLLWFPTGGGKTEAYLGVAAYTLAIRRLQGQIGGRDGGAGVAVLMRYTLRLLTLQQFQRATALICACELIRREDPTRWGREPFRIGLWVGRNSTPMWTDDAAEAVRTLREGGYYSGSTPHQLTNCPWCGTPIEAGQHIEIETRNQGRGRTLVYCGDTYGNCPFSKRQAPDEGLPILTVDEEIYARLPALLIATVDKFAQMPWNGRIAMLFGQVDGYCERHGYRSPEIEDSDSHSKRGRLPAARTVPAGPLRPPDLIIQDELHLISGPLGTMVGLYEAAVDRLCTWEVDGQAVRPKVIASTATVRRAESQVEKLFCRRLSIFPAQGLNAHDSFFAYQTPVTEAQPGRRYLGIYAPGIRHKAALIRVYTAYLSAAQSLYSTDGLGQAVDPWMTLVGYFNSLRELGSMKRAVDDSVSTRLRRMARANRPNLANRPISPYSVAELTSRRNATEIPAILDQLEIPFDLTAAERRKNKDRRYPLDVLLATNMISVGVDVARLGLMVVAGQPKNTAEYIQATSRVGRQFPGLVCTVYNWARPRDISHYERFEHYHATFYQHVEALSVTPFAPRALDRGLSGTLVALVRLLELTFNANQDAAKVSRDHAQIEAAVEALLRRAEAVDGPATAKFMRAALDKRMGFWANRIAITSGSGTRLGYREKRDNRTLGLLRDPEQHGWETFTCLNSLRDVEPSVNLVLNEFGMDREEGGAWHTPNAQPSAETETQVEDDTA